MTQKIEQQIDIKVTESGLETTVAKLKELDSLSKGLKTTTVKVAGSVKQASNQAAKSTNTYASAISKLNKSTDGAVKKTTQHVKSMSALTAAQIPVLQQQRATRKEFASLTAAENSSIDTTLRKIKANKTLNNQQLALASSLNTLSNKITKQEAAEKKSAAATAAATAKAQREKIDSILDYGKALNKTWSEQSTLGRMAGVDVGDFSRTNTAKYSAAGQSSLGKISDSEYKNLTTSTQKAAQSANFLSAAEQRTLNTAMKAAKTINQQHQAQLNAATSATQTISPLSKMADKLKSVGSQAKKSTTNIFHLRAAFALAAGAVYMVGSAISEWFSLSSDYAESMHLLYSTLASSMDGVAESEKTVTLYGKDVFGNMTNESIQVTEGVNDIINSLDDMADKMMLDPTQLNRTFSSFYEMANAAGMAQEKIGKLSKGMTQLTYDLASLWDVPFEEAASSLKSALSGITSSVKSYGIDISRTAADEWLMVNGFDATYNSLNRANKMIVIYNMLVEHTSTAQGDLARSALQPANMLRILGQQAQLAARQLGAAIFPVFTKLIPVAIMLAQAIQRVAAALSSFLGGVLGSWYTDASKQWSSYMQNLGQTSSGVEDIVDELEETEDAAGSAGSALEEMTDFTLPFDELHKMNEEMDSGGSGGSGSTDGLDLDIPVADMEAWSTSLKDILLGDAQETLDAIAAAIDNTFGEGTFDALVEGWNTAWGAIKSSLGTVFGTLQEVATAFIGMFDWPAFIDGFAEGFSSVLLVVAEFVQSVGSMFSTIMENKYVVNFFNEISGSLGNMLGKFAAIAAIVGGVSLAFGALNLVLTPLKVLLSPLGTALQVFSGALGGIISFATGAVSAIGELISIFTICEGPAGVLSLVMTTVGEAIAAISWPVVAVVAAIALLVGSFIACYESSQEFRDIVSECFNTVGEIIAGVIAALQPAFALIMDAFAQLKEALLNLQPLWEFLLEYIIPPLVALLGTALVVAITVVAGVFDLLAGVVKSVTSVLGDIFTVINSVIGGIIEFVGNLKTNIENFINSIVEFFSNNKTFVLDTANAIKDGIVDRFNGLKDRVSEIFNNVKNAITSPIESAKNTLSSIIDRIKSIFNINIEFPHFTLPHISWQTKTLPFFNISVPVGFTVDWYAKGGIFDGPTIAGLGEAGPEAVVPLSGARMRPFAEAVASELQTAGGIGSTSGNSNDDLVIAMSTAVYNAMIKGFPDSISTDVYLDATKVNNSLDNNKRQRGVGSSLVKAGA